MLTFPCSYKLRVALQHPGANVLSLTWMTGLNPMKVFCRFEVGGRCSNPACTSLHLRFGPGDKEHAMRTADGLVSLFDKLLPDVGEAVTRAKGEIAGGGDGERIVRELMVELCGRAGKVPMSGRFPEFGLALPRV